MNFLFVCLLFSFCFCLFDRCIHVQYTSSEIIYTSIDIAIRGIYFLFTC